MSLFRKAENVDQAGDHGHGDPAPSLTDGLSTSLLEVVLFKCRGVMRHHSVLVDSHVATRQ